MKIAVIEDEKVHRDLMLSYLERWNREFMFDARCKRTLSRRRKFAVAKYDS